MLVVASVHIAGYRCWRLQVLALEGTCLLLEVVSVGGYMFIVGSCECWRLHVLALEATCVCIKGCKC